jgi:hypothetical protein
MKIKTAAWLGIATVVALLASVAVSQARARDQAELGTSASPFVVLDRSGPFLGSVIGINLGGRTTTVPFKEKSLPVEELIAVRLLYFASSDCTGQPFGDASAGPFPAPAVSGPSDTLYFEEGLGQTLTAQSFLPGGHVRDVAGCTTHARREFFSLLTPDRWRLRLA